MQYFLTNGNLNDIIYEQSDEETRKYIDDVAIYAHCKCGFEYACSSSKRNKNGSWSLEQEITKLYYYCPNCGAHKKYYNDIPIKINKNRYE